MTVIEPTKPRYTKEEEYRQLTITIPNQRNWPEILFHGFGLDKAETRQILNDVQKLLPGKIQHENHQ